MTKDLYNALVAAWDVPCWCGGEIGEEEFLNYFVTGNGGSTVGEVVYVEVASVQGGKLNIELKYTELWEGKPRNGRATMMISGMTSAPKWNGKLKESKTESRREKAQISTWR